MNFAGLGEKGESLVKAASKPPATIRADIPFPGSQFLEESHAMGQPFQTRRKLIKGLTIGAAACLVPGVFAEELMRTPRQTEGPFYPDKMPLDTDNDLLLINDKITPAVGQILHLSGRILTASGSPVRNAVVEIWQVGARGAYIHSRSSNGDKRDGNFQGFGRFLTGSKGEYYFRTIKPVPYARRTPHIHFAINQGGKRMLTSQMYIKGLEMNQRDRIFMATGDAKTRQLLEAEFNPVEKSKTRELAASFDLVIGMTPES